MIAAIVLVVIANSSHAAMFDLGSVKMALWYDGEGDDRIQIMDVPRIHYQTGASRSFLIDDPFMISDRPTQDINIVSLYRIITGAELDSKDRPVKYFIDISKAENTRQLGYTIKQVTEAAAICIRACCPINEKIPLVVRDGKKETPIEPPKASTTEIFPAETGDKPEGANPANPTQTADQDGAGQPATRPESKSEGGDKPQPEAEGRSR